MKRGFGSDNHSGVSPEVLQALAEANTDHALAYGDDEYTLRLEELFRETFGPQAKVYLVFNGTGANVLCIDAMCRSHEAVVCAETAHINVDECGAPQRVVGCRLLTVDTPDGKLTPDLVRTRLHGFGFEHHSQPKAISISQPTELGTLYTLEEIKALADLAHSYDMYLHVDGARLANAAVALGCTFKEMTTDCGVDALSFGGTKNGLLMGESCVLLNPALDADMKYRRKQMTQLASKMRFMAAQMEAYLSVETRRAASAIMETHCDPSANTETCDPLAAVEMRRAASAIMETHCDPSANTETCDPLAAVETRRAASAIMETRHDASLQRAPLWYRNAEHSNRMAQLLKSEVEKVEGVKIMYPVQVNSVFAQLPTDVWHALQQRYFFYDWDEDKDIVRWMCSFDTTEQDIHDFVDALSVETRRAASPNPM